MGHQTTAAEDAAGLPLPWLGGLSQMALPLCPFRHLKHGEKQHLADRAHSKGPVRFYLILPAIL